MPDVPPRTCARPGLPGLLGTHRPVHSAVLRALRRSAAHMARHQPRRIEMPALSADAGGDRARPRDRAVRWISPGHRARAQVRRMPLPGARAGSADAGNRIGRSGRRVGGRSCAAAWPASTRAGIQPGRGDRTPSRTAGRPGAQTYARYAVADGFAGGTPSCQRARRVRGPSRDRRRWTSSGACRRRQHDRRNARVVRACVGSSRSGRGQGVDSSSSRVATARPTAAATSALGRCPSMRTQPGASAWRR